MCEGMKNGEMVNWWIEKLRVEWEMVRCKNVGTRHATSERLTFLVSISVSVSVIVIVFRYR